ncbi:sister chromatid cohesion protein 1 [Saccharomyces pastorianus]|uniref:Sister chromatid cohesion protein 1 n=1 Tax=Saccharomyces pastorianus TaxID=27292 RepID=A0A6C1E5J0_SACPS|nr:sister chromatid cohesion protein 1 [Saccharomyces pastorianus]
MATENPQRLTVLKLATNKGPLAQIWLASNMSNISRGSAIQTHIAESAKEIAKASGYGDETENVEHITLRTSGELLQGIVRVYSKQATFLLTDIKDTLTKISTLFKTNQGVHVTVSRLNTVTRVDQLILEDAVTEREVLVTPGLEFLDDTTIPVGLMAQENSMERKVQGAAPWDTSLEVGRRFNPDEDLEHNHMSSMDLDFDIEEGPMTSKSWEEGTRQSSHNFGAHENFIQDDDFPLGDAANADWDLGITENNGQSDNSDDHSVEQGRRVDGSMMSEEPTDFNFNLEIEKDAPMDDMDLSTGSLLEPQQSKQIRRRRNSQLLNTKNIQLDEETENSESPTSSNNYNQQGSSNSLTAQRVNITTKRLWSELAENMAYLPDSIFKNFLSYNSLKKRKVQNIIEGSIEEPELNMSLDLNEDVISNAAVSDGSFNDLDEDVAGFEPIDADLSEAPFLEEDLASTNTGSVETTTQTEKVRLVSGEVASKATVQMAEILRREITAEKEVMFTNVLRHQLNTSSENITRREASKGFFDILSLATEGCVDLKQKETFGNIVIDAKPALFERFITA